MNSRIFLGVFLLVAALDAGAGQNEDLISAIDAGSTARVKLLIGRGADANAPDDHGEPALMRALRAGKPDVAALLITTKGVDLDRENPSGENALMIAAYNGEKAIVQQLIAADAEINHTGWTALHYAATTGHDDIVRLLLDNAAYIDAESPNHTTPLMMAARAKDRTVCKTLIEEGADPTPKNDASLTAADFAAKAGDGELAEWLRKQAAAFRQAHPLPAGATR